MRNRFVTLTLRSACAALATIGMGFADEGTPGPEFPLRVQIGVPSPASGTGELPARPGQDGGEPGVVELIDIDDALPRPQPGKVVASAKGDKLVKQASGDPHYLSFAAGEHRPPVGERLDPRLGQAIAALGTDDRATAEVFAFIMMAKRITPQRIAALEALGVRHLGYHPYACLRAAIPVAALPDVANHPDVRWVGLAQPWQKIQPQLVSAFQDRGFDQQIGVYINLFEGDLNAQSVSEPVAGMSVIERDPGGATRAGTVPSEARRWQSNGWRQRALEQAGVRIREYVPTLNAFRAEVGYTELERIIAMDFVQYVEVELSIRPLHDESTPMILADRVRAFYDGGTNSAALVAEIDSGARTSHEMLNHAFYVGFDVTGSAGGAFSDTCDHGTHVLGTMLGLPPTSKAGRTGVAPGLGWGATGRVRVVKYLDFQTVLNDCAGILPVNIPIANLGPYTDGSGNLTPKPHVVNNSWGTDPGGLPWIGSEYLARSFDEEVFASDVMYVFAAGNAGPGSGSMGVPAAAKNVLAVGNVIDFQSTAGDPGVLSTSSSRGPCADNRWKPNVVAPGDTITSALGTGNTLYGDKTGTSMASPHVTGVVAQLVDRHSFLRYKPARIASLLMATATTKDNQALTSESDTHLDQFGAGRVDAYRAVYETSQMEWTNWGFDQAPFTWEYGDFVVGAGATRLVVCMHYTEAAISAGAGQALFNDYDLYIDQAPVDTINGNTGEFTAQQSNVDNTEIRTIENPAAGSWRWKTYPNFSLTPVKMGVTVHIIYGDTTPDGSLTVGADDIYVKPNEDITVTATVDNPHFVASAVFLDTIATTGMNLIASSTTLDDGIVTDLTGNATGGRDVLLGNIRHGDSRTATWVVDWATSGVKTFQVAARSDNWVDKNGSLTITVDGGIPGTVANLTSTNHSVNVWSNNSSIAYGWTAANDSLSGIDGYSVFTSSGAPSIPDQLKDINPVTTYSQGLTSSASGYYFNIRAVDKAGNWGDTSSTGPYLIDVTQPGAAANLISTSHALGVWSNNPAVSYKWNAAADPHSGIDGYGISLNVIGPSLPDAVKDIEGVTDVTQNLSSSTSGWHFNLRSVDNAGNWDTDFVSVGPIYIDAVAPGVVSGLTSTTHTPGVWSKQTSVSYTWTAANDSHSGLKGYGLETSTSSSTLPPAVQDIGLVTSYTETLSHNSNGQYFKIRAVDNAGNWAGFDGLVGPILIDTLAPTQPTALTSSHGSGWKNDPSVNVKWVAAVDADSGLAGYDTLFNTSPSTTPNGPIDTAANVTTLTTTLGTGEWYFHIRPDDTAGNSGLAAHFGPMRVDVTAPSAATGLSSTTHAVNSPDINGEIAMNWAPAGDAHSGLKGYIGLWDQLPTTVPAGAANILAPATSYTQTLIGNHAGWYFHLRSVDNAGNLGPTIHAGPYILLPCVKATNASYGTGKPGTNGVPVLNALAAPILGETSTVRLENALPGALPLLFLGVTQQNIPFDGGALLTEATWVLALPFPILADGTLPLTGTLPADPALCGFKLYHQVMFADPGAAGYYKLAQTAGLVRTFGY